MKWWVLRGTIPLFLAVPVGFVVSLIDPFSGTLAGLLLGSAGFVMIAIGFTYWNGESNTRKGWQGEVAMAAELSYLSDDYLLLNDVMLPGARGNIDHILVGPSGVFVFETKNYAGKYVCYGDRWFFQGRRQKYDVKSISLQAKNNASIVSDVLHSSGFTVEVNPLLVFTHPSAQLWLHRPTVPVLRGGTVRTFVLNQKPRFQLTGPYAEKVVNKILATNRAKAAPLHSTAMPTI
jgi:hypothetical protein